MPLSSAEQERYSRHTLLPEFGVEGQERLKAGRVLIVGAGGLGSPAALYLAAAGVGTIGLVDFDDVDVTNLQRQVLYGTSDVGRPKVDVAKAKLSDLNPHISIAVHRERLSAANASQLIAAYDVVIDGTDNFSTRYLVNDACVMARRPNVYGSVFRFEGQAAVFATADGPCYRCLHPEPPPAGLIPNCAEAGVLGVLPGIIGTIQATESLKLIMGIGEPLIGRFLIYDALRMRFRELKLPKDPDCPVCGARPAITTLRESAASCDTRASGARELSVRELKARLDSGRPPLILDVREPSEAAICRLPGARLIPLGELSRRLDELDPSAEIVVHCKSGGRSARAVAMLEDRGFAHVSNLTGGILQWISEIDGSLCRY